MPKSQSSAHSGHSSPSEPIKRRRITRACDRCHRSGVKCSTSADPNVCGPCAAFRSECTYNRPIKRRGPVPKVEKNERQPSLSRGRSENGEASWRYEALTSPEIVEVLVDTYHRIVYPILPYFHWPTFSSHVHSRRYVTDRAFCAATMSVCAITAARVRDGAGTVNNSISLPSSCPPSEAFYDAAIRAFPSDLSQALEFDYKRAKALLAMICVQYGHVRQLTAHIGDYITLCSIDGFHNESRWPPNLPETEIQERRRLFWGAYTIDVYASCTWGLIVRHREAQSTVLYPAEVYDDDEITEAGIVPRPVGRPSYLVGWNFTTDLYRILEHALSQIRQKPGDSRVTALYANRSGPSPGEALDLVSQLYKELPGDFKGAKAMTGNIEEDRYGFQAADIIVTMQTVKMVMMGLEDATVEKRCAIAGELLDALSTVPTAYIQAISSPILHHLAGVGHLLGGVIQSPLSHWSYLQVRNILLAMADLLSSLESTLSVVPGIADKLRDHVRRIDQYMTSAAQESRRAQVYHAPAPPAWPQPVTNTTMPPPPPLDWPKFAPATAGGDEFTLPIDLVQDWPFDMSDAFDFLGAV